MIQPGRICDGQLRSSRSARAGAPLASGPDEARRGKSAARSRRPDRAAFLTTRRRPSEVAAAANLPESLGTMQIAPEERERNFAEAWNLRLCHALACFHVTCDACFTNTLMQSVDITHLSIFGRHHGKQQ